MSENSTDTISTGSISSDDRLAMAPPFLRIPIEVRDQIYKLVLISDRPLSVVKQNREAGCRSARRNGHGFRPTEGQDDREVMEGRSLIAIMFTCRQIYREAGPNYYRENTFLLKTDKILDNWITSIGDACRKEIQSIILCAFDQVGNIIIPKLTGLRRLELSVDNIHVGLSFCTTCSRMESLEDFRISRTGARADLSSEGEEFLVSRDRALELWVNDSTAKLRRNKEEG